MTGIIDIWLRAHNVLRSGRTIIDANLRPLDLGSTEGNILLHLWTQGEEMGQEQLVEQLDLSKPAISRALDSLEAKGYVTRERSPDDRRAYRVELTPRARDIGPVIERAYNHVFALAVQGITQEEFEQFARLFDRISRNFTRERANAPREDADARQ